MTATFSPIAPRTRKGTPRITRTEHILDLFCERLTAPPSILDSLPSYEAKDSLSFRGDKLYHYGHFTLAHILRDGRRRPKLVLLNGDTWSGSGGWGPSTSSRQSDVRRAVAALDVPHMVVPFSALEGASIERESIVPLHVRSDRYTHHDVFVTEQPGEHPKIEHPDGLTEIVMDKRYGYVDPDTGEPRSEGSDRVWREYEIPVRKPVLVDDTERANVKAHPTHGWVRDYAIKQPDGRWKYTVERHWLGDAVFKARSNQYRGGKRVRPWGTYLSSFDYGEPNAPYFLCELPRSFDGETVDDAIAALMPAEVKAAIDSGLDVLRQGDIFAIPTSLTTAELESRAKAVVRERTVWSKEEGYYGMPDYRPSVSSLVPTTEKIRRFKAEGRYPKGATDIHGTNHSATALIVTKDGEQYGRGRLYHTPAESWRTPDHRVLKLGDGETWYRLVKNTVPLAKGQRGSSRSSTVFQSGQSRAWTIGGQVD